MNKFKQVIAKNFVSFTYFYRHLRYRVFIVIGLSILVGFLDGLGLSMFLPLLQMVEETSEVNTESMGRLAFLVEMLKESGIGINLLSILLFMLIFFLLKGVAKFFSMAYQIIVQVYFIRKIRIELLNDFNQIGFKYYVTSDVGRIQNTMSGEVDRVSIAFKNYFQAIDQLFLVAVYIGFAFYVDVTFALLVTIGGWLTNFVYKILYSQTKTASKKFTSDSHAYQGQIIQHVGNFKYLKATGLLRNYAQHLYSSIVQIEHARKRIGIIASFIGAIREPILIIVVAASILIYSNLMGGVLGTVFISLLFFYRALTALLNMQSIYNRFLAVSGSLYNIKDFQKELKRKLEKTGNVPFKGFKDKISLNNVHFSYNDNLILKDITLVIPKNKIVAFVGESGSGKTTLINILAALMPMDKGEMFIDSQSIKKIDALSYQKHIGYITQEPVIFNDSIYNNITFWADPTEENKKRFIHALKKAAIYDFIQTLPETVDTLLGHNGVNLSGGQKQRISIARELYKNIEILIMDEATSALDTETERAIQESIDALKGEYTILIVAHRLSTIKNADEIIVMKQGEIEAIGTFQDLIKNNYGFKKMVGLQEV